MRQGNIHFRRLKLVLMGISIVLLGVYILMVVPHAFAGWEDFLTLSIIHVLTYLTSQYVISPWLFVKARFRMWRLLLTYTVQVLLFMLVLIGVSIATGALRWQAGVWGILNVWETLLIFAWPNILGSLMFLLKRGLNDIGQYRLLNQQQETEINEIQFQYTQQKMLPHFLFNTLGMIRYFGRQDPKKATRAMTLLIDMSKFYLGEGNRVFTPLRAELDQVQRLVDIYSLRQGKSLYLDIDVGIAEDMIIPSMLLVNLVENCCQYGVMTDPEDPACLKITLSRDSHCRIRLRNTVGKNKMKGTLHGHANLQKMQKNLRLLDAVENDLQYGEENGVFVVEVTFKSYNPTRRNIQTIQKQ